MSKQAVRWVFGHSQATGSARMVLFCIAWHADANGDLSFPSIRTLADESGLDRRSVFRALRTLEELGEIEIQSGQASSQNNVYRIKGCQIVTPRRDRGVTPSDRGVTPSDRRGDTAVTQNRSEQIEQSLSRAYAHASVVVANDEIDHHGGDPLVVRAMQVGAGSSYEVAAAMIAELESEGIGRVVIDEAIGFAIVRKDHVRNLGFVMRTARDWMSQRDPEWGYA